MSLTVPLPTTAVRPTPIAERVNKKNHGIIFMRQSDIQAIYKQSGANAVGNEFQVHYWFINYRFTAEDGSILDIAVPTTYFNYPQVVNAAHIDFEMTDVNAVSEKAEALHNHIYQPLIASHFQLAIEQLLGVKFEVSSVKLGTIHRHPGSSSRQAFSGTDLMKNPEGHGIVYPFESAVSVPSFSGIMAVDAADGINRLAHMEYRIANGTLGTDIVYEQGRCQAIVIDDLPKGSIVECLFDDSVNLTCYTKSDSNKLKDVTTTDLASIYQSILEDFQPSTLLIDPANVTKKAVLTTGYQYWNRPSVEAVPAVVKPAALDSVTIKTDDELRAMTKTELNKHAIAIDAILFPNLDSSQEYLLMTKKDLIVELTAMQLDLLDTIEESKNSESTTETPVLTSGVAIIPEEILRNMTMTTLREHANALNAVLKHAQNTYNTYSFMQLIDEISFLQIELEDLRSKATKLQATPTQAVRDINALMTFKRKKLIEVGYASLLVDSYPDATVTALYARYFSDPTS